MSEDNHAGSADAGNHSAPKGTPDHERERIQALLFQMDNLLHTRVNSFLVAQSLFFVAAATAFTQFWFVVALSVSGIATTLLFTFTNLKLYLRVTWLIYELKRCDEKSTNLYNRYLELENLQTMKKWGPISLRVIKFISRESPRVQPSYLDTGWLFTWGLMIVSILAWVSLPVTSRLASVATVSAGSPAPPSIAGQGVDTTLATTNQPFSEHTVLAIVLPDGAAVFAVRGRKDVAVTKAIRLSEAAAKRTSKEPQAVAPQVFTYSSPEELFAAVDPQTRNMPGVRLLVANETCGTKVLRKEYPCNQVGTNFAKAVYFEHYMCQSGTNGCWETKTVIGANYYYNSKEACETNGTPIRSESLWGYRCD